MSKRKHITTNWHWKPDIQDSGFSAKPDKPKKRKGKNRKGCKRRSQYTDFFRSREWFEIRYKVLTYWGQVCMCCGATPDSGAILHVDHIIPRSKRRDLELVFDNLQVLCEACNIGKSNTDYTDFRPVDPVDISGISVSEERLEFFLSRLKH